MLKTVSKPYVCFRQWKIAVAKVKVKAKAKYLRLHELTEKNSYY